MIERTCTGCTASHKTILYKRITDGTGIDFRELFTSNWFSKPNGKGNALNTDFKLYSSLADAQANRKAWTYCSYDDPGIGFPRDCGPSGKSGGQWNSKTRGGQTVTWRIEGEIIHRHRASPAAASIVPPCLPSSVLSEMRPISHIHWHPSNHVSEQ